VNYTTLSALVIFQVSCSLLGFFRSGITPLPYKASTPRLLSASHQAKAPTETASQESLNISTTPVRAYFGKNNTVVISEAPCAVAELFSFDTTFLRVY